MKHRSVTARRLIVLHVLVVSLLLSLGGRLYYLQIHDGQRYALAAANNRIREVITPAPRGEILDRNGIPLVANTTSLVVSVSRPELQQEPDGGTALLTRLAGLLGRPLDEITGRTKLCGEPEAPAPPRCWNGSPYQPIPVMINADPQVALQVLERREEFPGVSAELAAVRSYPTPYGVNAAHLIGYVGPITQEELARRNSERLTDPANARAVSQQIRGTDQVGRAGLEKQYDEVIRGTPGVRSLSVDHGGVVTGVVDEVAPIAGADLVTTIDARLQAVVERELLHTIEATRTKRDYETGEKLKADSGAAVVLDTRTGEVLAMASYPSYDPKVWVGGISAKQYATITGEDSNYPMISRATQGQFAPASTFKVITLPAAVQHGGYPLDARYNCSSEYELPGRTVHNFESIGYGLIDLEFAINISCDTIFYRWAYEMYLHNGASNGIGPGDIQAATQADDRDAMVSMARSFGLGKPTGIDVPDEASGRIAAREWKEKYWESTKDANCQAAQAGYPDIAATDPTRASYLQQLARENCAEGYRYRPGDAVNFSIGQGDMLVTPLQLARAYAAIGNGGQLWTPRLARALVTAEGNVVQRFEPHSDGQLPLEPKVRDFLQKALRTTTQKGTSSGPFWKERFPVEYIPVASKTGTAEVYGKQTTSWLASYAPATNPRYAVVMMISQGGTGARAAAPGVARIYREIFGVDRRGNIHPDKALFGSAGPSQQLPQGRQAAKKADLAGMTLPASPVNGVVNAGSPASTPPDRRRQVRR